jgi:hypothetical protein
MQTASSRCYSTNKKAYCAVLLVQLEEYRQYGTAKVQYTYTVGTCTLEPSLSVVGPLYYHQL